MSQFREKLRIQRLKVVYMKINNKYNNTTMIKETFAKHNPSSQMMCEGYINKANLILSIINPYNDNLVQASKYFSSVP